MVKKGKLAWQGSYSPYITDVFGKFWIKFVERGFFNEHNSTTGFLLIVYNLILTVNLELCNCQNDKAIRR